MTRQLTPNSYMTVSKHKQGFSLIEIIVVIVIIAILVVIAYPALQNYFPTYKTRADVRKLEVLFQRARIQATNLQKPVRVVLNCSVPNSACFVKTQTAVYDNGQVDSWYSRLQDRVFLDSNVKIAKLNPDDDHDGDVSLSRIYWTIFMPDGRVFSDPKNEAVGFEIFVYYQRSGNPKTGWGLTVGKETGRVVTSPNITLSVI